MKNKLIALFLLGAAAITSFAQTPVQTFIKGDLNIKFDSRQRPGEENVTDKYALNINVSNSAMYKGTLEYRPYISTTFGSQAAQLSYSVETDVVHPTNPSITRNVGKIYGTVPINENNVYNFSAGSSKITVFGIGSARGFESKFSGQAIGKPPAKTGFAKAKQEALKMVNGKGKAISIGKYDKMEFQSITLPMGPVAIYPEVSVSGAMIYDYARSAWHFQNVTVTYASEGQRKQDTLTGNIRWGNSEYSFDIKVNEPPPSETAIFAAASDEAAFFAVDDANPSLGGTMKYKDTNTGGTVTASNIAIDLVGNKLSKQQTMYLAKLIFLVAVVPVNND